MVVYVRRCRARVEVRSRAANVSWVRMIERRSSGTRSVGAASHEAAGQRRRRSNDTAPDRVYPTRSPLSTGYS